MELVKLEALLEAYFEGNTSIEEENSLREYFTGGHVAPQFEMYVPMFLGFQIASEEKTSIEIELPSAKIRSLKPWYGIAATLLVGLGIAGFMFFNGSGLTAEEEEALAAYREAQSSLQLMSENLNKGTSSIALLEEFSKGQEKLAHLNQFEENRKKILK